MSNENINDYLYTWNAAPSEHLKTVRIDDDIRDGMQAAFIRRPSLSERKELLSLSAKVGTYSTVIGFPAISPQELADCHELVQHIEENNLHKVLAFLSRMLVQDLEPIVEINHNSNLKVRAEMFLGTSPLRRRVEEWDFEKMLKRIHSAAKYLHDNNTGFGMSCEDATRTPPKDLELVLDTMLDAGPMSLAICDTVGESTPSGAARITEFFLEKVAKSGQTIEVIWHGHNDKGLSVANALASARAGANTISGTFLGIGERAGNTPLEQVIMQLYQAGSRLYNLDQIQAYCDKWAEYANIPIIPMTPLVGKQAFATSAGTHSAAILKARKLGLEFEDYVFSGVPAHKLRRIQDVVIGPTSGMYNAHYMLEQIGISGSQELARELLEYAKGQNRWLTSEDIHAYVANLA